MKPNVKEMQRVLDFIRQDLRRLKMDTFGVKKDLIVEADRDVRETYRYYPFPDCGTVACFAGWTRLLNSPDNCENVFTIWSGELDCSTAQLAQDILQLSEEEAKFIFYQYGDLTLKLPEIQYQELVGRINAVLAVHAMPDRVH